MLRFIATTFISLIMLSGHHAEEKIPFNISVATCYGYTPCKACSNCSQCKFCSNGGTCGVCKEDKNNYKTKKPPASAIQCKAITKKGTRCKRTAGSNGYCWQHQ